MCEVVMSWSSKALLNLLDSAAFVNLKSCEAPVPFLSSILRAQTPQRESPLRLPFPHLHRLNPSQRLMYLYNNNSSLIHIPIGDEY
jgi:hypothetical protein